ncbi:MAG TPA: GNAT family N-acetyltransferase [Legionellaceae bacterium]|nr:GNAT family N-acetyltransferase [Legionellaceae bacterium]
MDELKVSIKPGLELSKLEKDQINKAKSTEWNLADMDEEHLTKHLFVLVKDANDQIVAQGQLLPLQDVRFMGQKFSIIEIGGVVAHIKGQGYGSKMMEGVKQYLRENKKTGIGFTSMFISRFYAKCGFTINKELLSQFPNHQEITGDLEQCVFYIDSEDHFVEKVLANPTEFVHLA